MVKFFNYFKKNIITIICILLLSITYIFFIFPNIVKLSLLKPIFLQSSFNDFIGITASIMFLLIISWNKMHKYWEKVRNTYNLENPPFLFIHSFILFICLNISLKILFRLDFIFDLFISKYSIMFFTLNIVLLMAWGSSSYFVKTKEQFDLSPPLKNENMVELLDDPISFLEQDSLGRKRFVEDLKREIISIPSENSAVTIGLNGSWGEGKTSIVNILRNIFLKNEKFLVVNFIPWSFKDEEAILTAFYQQIKQAINNKFLLPGFAKDLNKYMNIISMGFSGKGININLNNSEESLEIIKERVEKFIEQIGKTIIIFIDDIDRLKSDEVFLIVKLIRSCTNFKNTIFFLTFDELVIKNCLDKELNLGPEFLEKIIQRPISLPQIEQLSIDNFLKTYRDDLFHELNISQDRIDKFKKDFELIYQTQIKKIIKTLRRAKIYLNGLFFTLPPIKNEVNLNDFFILEIIRNFYPSIYDDIWKNPWSYIPLDGEYFFSSPFYSNVDENEKNLIIKNHIEDLLRSEKDRDIIIELIKRLFYIAKDALEGHRIAQYSVDIYRVDKKITHPDCFRKYFMLKVPSTELSDEFVETTLNLFSNTKEEEIEKAISEKIFDLQKQDKLHKYLDKLPIFTKNISENVSLPLIRVLYKNSNIFSMKSRDIFDSSQYDKSIKVLLFIINDNIKKDQMYFVLKEIIDDASLAYSVSIIYFCQRRNRGELYNICEIINEEKLIELQDLLSKRLKKYYVEEKRNIFKEIPKNYIGWGFVLHQWGSNWETFEGENSKIVNNYVISLIKDNPARFIEFIKSQKGLTIEDDKIVFSLKDISHIYNIEELYKLSKKFIKDSQLSTEEKEIIKIFITTYQNHSKN